MANWTTDSRSVTTDSWVKVTSEDGRTGRLSITQDNPGFVKFGSQVYDVEVDIVDGFPVTGKTVLLDKHPTINGIEPEGWIVTYKRTNQPKEQLERSQTSLSRSMSMTGKGGWMVSFRRGDKRRTVTMAYPEKRYYSDAELACGGEQCCGCSVCTPDA